MAPWLRMYGSYQGRECSTRPCHGSGYAHSALEHSQLTYGDAIGMSGMQLLRCWYCAIPGPCPTPPGEGAGAGGSVKVTCVRKMADAAALYCVFYLY